MSAGGKPINKAVQPCFFVQITGPPGIEDRGVAFVDVLRLAFQSCPWPLQPYSPLT